MLKFWIRFSRFNTVLHQTKGDIVELNKSVRPFRGPPFCTPTRLPTNLQCRPVGRARVSIACWKFHRERKRFETSISTVERERSFCSYIRRALISKSEGCSHTVTTLHQTRSVTAKRAVRRLCSVLQGVPLRSVSDHRDFRINRSLSVPLSAPIGNVSGKQSNQQRYAINVQS